MTSDFDLLLLLITGIVVILFSIYIIRIHPTNIDRNRTDLDERNRMRIKRTGKVVGSVMMVIGILCLGLFAYLQIDRILNR